MKTSKFSTGIIALAILLTTSLTAIARMVEAQYGNGERALGFLFVYKDHCRVIIPRHLLSTGMRGATNEIKIIDYVADDSIDAKIIDNPEHPLLNIDYFVAELPSNTGWRCVRQNWHQLGVQNADSYVKQIMSSKDKRDGWLLYLERGTGKERSIRVEVSAKGDFEFSVSVSPNGLNTPRLHRGLSGGLLMVEHRLVGFFLAVENNAKRGRALTIDAVASAFGPLLIGKPRSLVKNNTNKLGDLSVNPDTQQQSAKFVSVDEQIASKPKYLTFCDVLTADPEDENRHHDVAMPKAFHEINFGEAISACLSALEKTPDSGRLNYQLGRAFHGKYRKLRDESAASKAFEHYLVAISENHTLAIRNLKALLIEDHPKFCQNIKCVNQILWQLNNPKNNWASLSLILKGDIYRDRDPNELPCADRKSCDLDAFVAYQNALKMGNEEADAKIGYLFDTERVPTKCSSEGCIEDAIYHYERAEIFGIVWAQANLGNLYLLNRVGDRCKSEKICIDIAQDKLSKATASGNAYAARRLGDLYKDHAPDGLDCENREKCDIRAFVYYRKAVELGDKESNAKIGYLFEYNRASDMCSEDGCLEDALQYYEKAEADKVAWGQANLGLLFYKGKANNRCDSRENCLKISIEKLNNAKSLGNGFASLVLGRIYRDNDPKMLNCKDKSDCDIRAYDFFSEAVILGDKEGNAAIGHLFDNGRATSKCSPAGCVEDAVIHYELAEADGFVWAKANLGNMYLQQRVGKRCNQVTDCREIAIGKLTEAVDAGNAYATRRMGDVYRDNDPEHLDCTDRAGCDVRAYEFYQRAVELNDGYALGSIGYLFHLGRARSKCSPSGCKEDAIQLYEKAEAKGVLWAQHNLAIMYQNMEVGERCVDLADCMAIAFEKLMTASDAGYGRSRHRLADMYYHNPEFTPCTTTESSSQRTRCLSLALQAYEHALKQGEKYAIDQIASIRLEHLQEESICPAGPRQCVRQTLAAMKEQLENGEPNFSMGTVSILEDSAFEKFPYLFNEYFQCTTKEECREILTLSP